MPVISALNSLAIPYAIGGSVASSLYGDPRSTRDLDLVAKMDGGQVAEFVAALGDHYYADEMAIREAVRSARSFNVIHLATMVKIDVFISKQTPFARSQLERSRVTEIGFDPPFSASFASPEDTILSKLDWYRLGGETSDRQWNDILGVLKVQGQSLDFAYLDRWAAELRVADLLARARDDAGV